jgi:RimJ/RimL family protein N-acetyltransferase
MQDEKNLTPFLDGKQVYLRGLRVSDAQGNYCRWMNDPAVTRCLESRFFPSTVENLEAYVTRMLNDPTYVFLAIIAKDSNTHIGNVKLGPINWIHRFGDIGILLGEKSYWRRGIASEVIKIFAGYAFRQLNLHKLTAGCYSTNPGAIKAFEKAGFVREGIRKSQYYWDGKYVDCVLLGCVQPSL